MRQRTIDWEAVRRDVGGRCFICEFLARNPHFAYHVVTDQGLDLGEEDMQSLAERIRAAF
jgi:hypothetical protein